MFCPKCNAFHDDEYLFCIDCGAPLLSAKPKKGRLWPPVIFMAVMLIIGIAVFLLYPADAVLADTPWFRTENGSLSFDAAAYTGSPELTVPDGITTLAEDCFRNCDLLQTVFLPDSLTDIGQCAFAECDALRGVKIPEGVTRIGAGAFRGCAALEALSIPATVETVGNNAFRDCGALRYIFFEGTKQQWLALNVGIFGTQTTIYCVDGTI